MCSNIQSAAVFVFKTLIKVYNVYTFKKVCTAHIEVRGDVTANDSRLKQSKCQLRPFKTVKFQIHSGSPNLKIL